VNPVETPAPAEPSLFAYVSCQQGAEVALKAEVARFWPDYRLAFSRPGFLTFKLPPGQRIGSPWFGPFGDTWSDCPAVFARAWGQALGPLPKSTMEERVGKILARAQELGAARIHVWARDLYRAGQFDFEPRLTPACRELETALQTAQIARTEAARTEIARTEPAETDAAATETARTNSVRTWPVGGAAQLGEVVLDVIQVDPESWWLGLHRHTSPRLPWPGGLDNLELPSHAVSRAYLKMVQTLEWSRLPLLPGELVAELGSSPGGSSQALLERGMHVLGVDPAEVDATVLAHPRFTHLRGRSIAIKRLHFEHVQWLAVDMNVAPKYTLDAVEGILYHVPHHLRGLILTLKLSNWDMADDIPNFMARVRGWGFPQIVARQLQFHRQEFALAAWRAAPRAQPVPHEPAAADEAHEKPGAGPRRSPRGRSRRSSP